MPTIPAYTYHEPRKRRTPPPDPLSQWLHYLDLLCWEKGSLDDTGNRAFLRAGSLEIPAQTAYDEIARRIETAGDHVRPAKLKAQLTSAYTWAGTKHPGQFNNWSAIPKWPDPNYELIDRLVRQSDIDLAELAESSPYRFDCGRSYTEEIIDTLFPGNPLICVGKNEAIFETRFREEFRGLLSKCALIVPNPMLARVGKTQAGTLSQHSLEATAAKVYQVVEFDLQADHPIVSAWQNDGITLADASAALHWQLSNRLPLVVATHSGNKSLHGWYYVVGVGELVLRAFMAYAVTLGADYHTYARSQFVRIPDGRRETGERQTAFYLNPQNAVKI